MGLWRDYPWNVIIFHIQLLFHPLYLFGVFLEPLLFCFRGTAVFCFWSCRNLFGVEEVIAEVLRYMILADGVEDEMMGNSRSSRYNSIAEKAFECG
jgi:hypothetical protein